MQVQHDRGTAAGAATAAVAAGRGDHRSLVDVVLLPLATRTALIATLSVYAGAIHLYVVPEHLREWWGFGVFFLAVGVAQIAFALLLWRRPGTVTALAGIAGNVAVVFVYVLSRTNGVPVGPVHSSHRLEAPGVLDLTATAVEVGLAACLLALLSGRVRSITLNLLCLSGLVLWALRLTGYLA
jgi:hypothetical protein